LIRSCFRISTFSSYSVRENLDIQDNRYDANGNRTNPGYVTGANNRLLSDGKFNYEYDGEGNVISQTDILTGDVTL
jgi:hypothetical protein